MHDSILLGESVQELVGNRDGTYVDGTFGCGGHTSHLLDVLGPKSRLLALDWEAGSFSAMPRDVRVTSSHSNFSSLDVTLQKEMLGCRSVDGILLDLGFSDCQLLGGSSGLSFRREGFLSMRLGDQSPSASNWLQQTSKNTIQHSLRTLGNEKQPHLLATTLNRKARTLTNTGNLVSTILKVKANCLLTTKRHPATKVFRTIRMMVNREPENLATLLVKASDFLKLDGKLVIITFNSVEDHIIRTFLTASDCQLKLVKRISPTKTEVLLNHKARSAKALVLKKCD